MQLVTATVANDPKTAGVTWSAVTGLGSLDRLRPPQRSPYNAPATVAVASTATFTAPSVTDPTKSVTYTVNSGSATSDPTHDDHGGWKRERSVQFCSEYVWRHCALYLGHCSGTHRTNP